MATQPSSRVPLLSGVAALVIAVSVLVTGFSQNWWRPVETPITTTSASPSAIPSDIVSYKGVEGVDALTVLKQSATVETKDTSFGPMVMTVNGRTAGASEYWQFFVNGESASVGAHLYTTKATDTVEWRITAF